MYEISILLNNMLIKKLLIYALTRWLMGNNFIWTSCLRLWRHIWHFDFKDEIGKKSEVQVYIFSRALFRRHNKHNVSLFLFETIFQSMNTQKNKILFIMQYIQRKFITNCTVIPILTCKYFAQSQKSQNRNFCEF